jgi:ABC-type dipeptide/oligopeptide/nickel transport system ATPase component
MFEGQVVEEVPVRQLFAEPAHPFSQLLIASIELTDRRKDIRPS